MEPEWLAWTREIEAIAQTGLAFTRDIYDRERYERLRGLAAQMMAERSGTDPSFIAALFAGERGYATPKIDVRGAAFRDGKILLVRERADEGRWTLPGGWADVNRSPREAVISEMREEAGIDVIPVKLAALYDRRQHPHPPLPFHIYKLFFICEITGGTPAPGVETEGVGFFALDALPEQLSTSRVLPSQIARMFAHRAAPDLPTEFD
ncbi:MAG TPA: NUDIX hydrolase [Acetobacteraceae bacterium]|nr:NUDIX hydrolase [Acetobacteraceae bacterium]